MTRGAIYRHFKDKAELVHAMCERATLPMEAVFNEVTAVAGDDPLGSIRRLTVHMLTQVAQSPQQQTVFDILFRVRRLGEMAPMFEREQQSRNECHSEIENHVPAGGQAGAVAGRHRHRDGDAGVARVHDRTDA